MKRIAIIFTILFALIIHATAQTTASGSISANTTWTKVNSPYIVTGNILVNSGIILTIEPGVTIKFNSLKSIQISGTLIAQGTATDSIIFTSNTTNTADAWGYIYFSSTSTDADFENDIYGKYLSGSILEYCGIHYAGGATVENNAALRLDGAHPFINHCTISDNGSRGIIAYNLNGELKITHSLITRNTADHDKSEIGGGMLILGNGRNTLISANIISYNTANIGGGISTAENLTDGAIITNNIISNNTAYHGGGIGNISNATIMYNVVMNNLAMNINGGGGISAENGDGTVDDIGMVSGNVIINNSAYEYGGLYLSWVPASYNIIADNTSTQGPGTIKYYARPVYNNHIIRNSATSDVGILSEYFETGSNILSNTFAYNKSADLTNSSAVLNIAGFPFVNNNNFITNSTRYNLNNANAQGTANISATSNWWGTSNENDIQDKIFDWLDDETKGMFNYSPYLITPCVSAPVSPPANATRADLGNGQIKLTWNKNPESDIAGYHIYYGGFTGYSFDNMITVTDTTYILTGASIEDSIAVTAYDTGYSAVNELASTIVYDNMINGNESWFSYAEKMTLSGLNQHSINTIVVVANSVTETLTVNGLEGTALLTLSDLSGRLLISKLITAGESVPLNSLSKGIYLAIINSRDATVTHKIQKQ